VLLQKHTRTLTEVSNMSGQAGFIGLGHMGQEIARRLIEHGYALTIYDERPEAMESLRVAGANTAGSPAEVASTCDVVLACLPTPSIVADVVSGNRGLLEGSKLNTFIDLSTTGPVTAREIASTLTQAGIATLDAPVSGGVSGAKAGSLAIMVSGPKESAVEHKAMLEVIGKNIFYVGGEPGQGQMMKLLNNILSAGAFALTSEAMALGVKSGLNSDTMLAVFNASSGFNSATRDKFPTAVVTGTFDYGFAISLMCKDINLCLEQAEQYGVSMSVGQSVKQLWNYVASQRDGNSDVTTLAQEVEEWAGVKIRSQP
jgi:2-hydroxy-3-oxopropionate reductase